MKNILDKDSYVGIKDAAKYLGVSSLTVRKWVKCGELKSLTVKNPINKKDMYIIHKNELRFFKDTIFPEIYKKRNVPKKYRKETFWRRLKTLLERIKNAIYL